MKKIIKIFSLSLLMIILVTNISYATTVVDEQVYKSLEKMFSNDIRIEQNSSKEAIILKGQDIQIQGNEIKIIDKDNEKEFNIKYTLENSVCKFESSIPIEITSNFTEEEMVKEFSPIMEQLGNYDICYLAVADALGVDLSLAYTYYAQNYNNETINTQNKVYSIKTNLSTENSNIIEYNNFTIELEVNCTELMNLSSNDIDSSDTYTVTVITKEEDTIEEGTTSTQEGTEKENQEKKGDNTVSKNEIPKAGINKIFVFIVLGIVILAILMYKKNKQYSGIL